MVILPDGQVTICEQLYWDERFIIGNIHNQTISEVWNSPQALKLATLKRNDIKKESVCHSCDIFEECYSHHNICIANVMKAYGKENWDYPDPRCKKAPTFINDIAISS